MPDIAQMRKEYFGGGWDEEHEALKDDNTCCHQSMAIWLMICNGILIILALACFIVGIVITTKPAFTFTAGSLGVGCIFLGLFLLMVGGLGICAACRRSKCGLGIYSVLLTIFLLGELGAMAVAIAAPGVAVTGMLNTWTPLSNDYKDFIGLYYGCCSADRANVANKDLAGETQDENDVWTNNGVYCDAGEGAAQVTELGAKCQVHGLVWQAESYNNYVFAAYSTTGGGGRRLTENGGEDESSEPMPQAGAMNQDSTAWMDHKANLEAPATACTGDLQDTSGAEWAFGPQQGDYRCSCPKAETPQDNNPVDVACRQFVGAIPVCTAEAATPFSFAAGVSNAEVEAGADAGAIACYAKFENWLAANMGGTIAVLVILFLYQIFNVGFACALWCNKCSKKKSDEDPEIVDQGLGANV